MKKNKRADKILNHAPDIIFGILAGSGLMFVVNGLISSVVILISSLQSYFLIMYTLLYLAIFISTSILYAKGWFRIFYIISGSILLLASIYAQIF